jgi:hypothetical protein
MRTRGWMIWMAMAMNVVEAEQEDGVHHTQVDANIASPLKFLIQEFLKNKKVFYNY